jgi:hypothetical protein
MRQMSHEKANGVTHAGSQPSTVSVAAECGNGAIAARRSTDGGAMIRAISADEAAVDQTEQKLVGII